MSVGIVIVTHGSTGKSLVEVAEFILGEPMVGLHLMAFSQLPGQSSTAEDIGEVMDAADMGDGVLVLTDLLGASPSNLVAEQLEAHKGVMVTGLNLAMLVRVWNYRSQPLGLLARKALDGGRHGIKIFQR